MTTLQDELASALRAVSEFPLTDGSNLDAWNIKRIAIDSLTGLLARHEAMLASMPEAVRASPAEQCICPRCGLRHGHVYLDAVF